MALTGLDPQKVSVAIEGVNTSYKDVMEALLGNNQNTFVNPMSAVWGSPQAKEFFTNYQTVITEMCTEITKVYKSVIESMNSAAQSLASIAGAEWGTKEFADITTTLDVSCIKENIDGVVGIDETQAVSIASQLNTVMAAVGNAISVALWHVRSSGFVGGEMQSSLVSSLQKIGSNIADTFNELKNKVNSAIQETVSAYGTTSTNISSAFGGGAG